MINTIKYIIIIFLILAPCISNSQTNNEVHYLSISHEISNYAKWKVVFDQCKAQRSASGIVDIFVKKDVDNINSITIFSKITNLKMAKDFVNGEILATAMKNAGVIGPPNIIFYKSSGKYSKINTTALVTSISHSVENFNKWKNEYDAGEKIRKKEGIIDHLLLQNISDNQFVTVIGSSSSASNFNEFINNPDLKMAMKKGGVLSRPEVKILF